MLKELSKNEVIYDFGLEGIDISGERCLLPELKEVYDSLKTALDIKNPGYNVYLIDDFTKDKLKNVEEYIEKLLENRPRPKDICFVVKGDEKTPSVIYTDGGAGIKFKNSVENIQKMYSDITYKFYNSPISKEKEEIVDSLQKKRNEEVNRLVKMAEDEGFEIKPTQTGFSFIPINEGELMTEKEYDSLGQEEKEAILEKVNKLKESAQDLLEGMKIIEKENIDRLKEILVDYYNTEMVDTKAEVAEVISGNQEALEYISFVCDEIEKSIVEIYSITYEDDEEAINEVILRFGVSLLVDNEKNDHPRVVFEEDPSIGNLLGSIEYESKNGGYVTDVSLIKAGSLLIANEGCLIIRLNSLLSNQAAYYYLKKCLFSEKVDLGYSKGYLELLSINGIKPDAININTKVILIGDFESFEILYSYDEDFKKLFKIKAEYNPYIELDDCCKKNLLLNINRICDENNLKKVNDGAIKEVAKFMARKAENRQKLLFDNLELNKILVLANQRVCEANKDEIDGEDIVNILNKEDIIEKEILKQYKEGKMLISTEGTVVGQINALSVIDLGYCSFGKPMRITCSCYKGDGKIVDAHKESNLSGNIHSKSINILKGYISNLLGGYNLIPVDFHLSFEQLYGKLEGDSASVAEVICIISALSKIPIKQTMAVTGSVNQFGQVQPIGGVNDKIEGFFKVCNLMGTSKGRGVLIPMSNTEDLILKNYIEQEIEKGDFHLYAMETIDDAIKALMCDEKTSLQDVKDAIKSELKNIAEKKGNQEEKKTRGEEIRGLLD